MTRQSYGSGDTNYIDFEYDSLDRVVKKSYNGNDSSSISYMYDPNGNLYRTEDKLWNMGTVYEYTWWEKLIHIHMTQTGIY